MFQVEVYWKLSPGSLLKEKNNYHQGLWSCQWWACYESERTQRCDLSYGSDSQWQVPGYSWIRPYCQDKHFPIIIWRVHRRRWKLRAHHWRLCSLSCRLLDRSHSSTSPRHHQHRHLLLRRLSEAMGVQNCLKGVSDSTGNFDKWLQSQPKKGLPYSCISLWK